MAIRSFFHHNNKKARTTEVVIRTDDFVEPWIYIPQIQPDDIDTLCASAKPDSFLTSESSLMSGSIALRLLTRDLLTYSMRLTEILLSQWHPASFVVLTAGKDLFRILTGFRSEHFRTHKCGPVHQHPVLNYKNPVIITMKLFVRVS